MSLRGKKLGIMLSTRPDQIGFRHGLHLAETALANGVKVYLYCIDDAVRGVDEPRLQELKAQGLHLFACAHAAQQRRLPISEAAVFSGLSTVSDVITGTDQFVSFN